MTARSSERLRPEDIAELLRRGIREHVLVPGQKLVQDDLAERFGVSRNPVREALRMLAADGLVTLAAGEGAAVRSLTEQDLDELYELRLSIEPGLAARICTRATPADISSLRSLARALDAPQPVEKWLRNNYVFHTSLFALAGRPHTERILANLLTLVQPYSMLNVEHLHGRDKANRDHLKMVEAIEAGRSKELAALLRSHLAEARDRLLAARVIDEEDALALLRGLGT